MAGSGSVSTDKSLWEAYQSANARGDKEEALSTLSAYLQSWVKSGRWTQTSMISSSCDRYGYLKPCIAFDLPGEEWLVIQRPHGLLVELEYHVKELKEMLGEKEHTEQLKFKSSNLLYRVSIATLVLARVGGSPLNYSQIKHRALTLVPAILGLLDELLSLFKWSPTKENTMAIISSLSYGTAFFHALVDPRRYWQKMFMSVHGIPGFQLDQIISITAPVPELFVTIFNQHWMEQIREDCMGALLDLKLEVLNMIGAFFSSSLDNSRLAASEKVCLKLRELFDPREECSAIQVLTTHVFIRVVRVLHSFGAETLVGVDSDMMLVTFINLLSPRGDEGKLISPCIRLVSTLLDAVPVMFDQKYGKDINSDLKEQFVTLGCYEKTSEVLKLVAEEASQNETEARQLVCSLFKAFSSVTRNCPGTRQDFENRVSHHDLLDQITKVTAPTEEILQEALNMAVEGEYVFEGQCHTVYNTSAVKMLFVWLDRLPQDLQYWLSKRLHTMCSCGAHNKQRCCVAGVLKTVLQVLMQSQEQGHALPLAIEELLVESVEGLGAHSIHIGELKQLIGSLRTLENGKLPTYYYGLLKSLSVMADSGSQGTAPLYYFDLRMPNTYIEIPELTKFPTSSSFSFHTWVCLDSTSFKKKYGAELDDDDDTPKSFKQRRVLYSFITSGGTGFEVFFTSHAETTRICNLVVATVSKKEVVTLSLTEFHFKANRWYSLGIVYNVPRRLWGKSEVQVFVNGEMKKVAIMKTPNFSDTFEVSRIGFVAVPKKAHMTECWPSRLSSSNLPVVSDVSLEKAEAMQTTMVGDMCRRWGTVANLGGLLSSFCIFSDSLNSSHFSSLHELGPNDLSLFQHKSETCELGAKLYLYYNAKSVKDVCINLSPSQVNSTVKLSGSFTGQYYITWNVQAVLGSLGGVQLLFPILEQACLPVAERPDASSDGDTAAGSDEPVKSVSNVEERTDSQTDDNHGNPSCKSFREEESVNAFFKLLLAMLSNNLSNQNSLFHSEGPATIAALLMKTPPTLLTVTAFKSIKALVELFKGDESSRGEVYGHLIFDFRVWSRPGASVRTVHIQYVSNILRNYYEVWRQTYGIQYIVDVIRQFYSSESTSPCSDSVQLTEQNVQSIQEALVMIIQYYLMKGATLEEVDGLLAFIVASKDTHLQERLLGVLKNLLTSSDMRKDKEMARSTWEKDLGRMVWEKGIFLLSLMRASSMPVRLIAIKMVSYLTVHYSEVDSVLSTALKGGSVAAAIRCMVEPSMSSAIVLALTDLCVAKEWNTCTDFISNMDIFMSVLHLLRQAPFNVRSTLCQLFNSILYHTPEDVTKISVLHGWEVMFFYLLTPYSPQSRSQSQSQTPNQSDVPLQSPPHPPILQVETTAQNSTNPDSASTTEPLNDAHQNNNVTPLSTRDGSPPPPYSSLYPNAPSSVADNSVPYSINNNEHSQASARSSKPIDDTCLLLPDHAVCKVKPDSLDLTEPSTENYFRSRSRVFVAKRPGSRKEYTITERNELIQNTSGDSTPRRVSIGVSTPWTESVDSFVDEEITRTVDVIVQMIKQVLWASMVDVPAWKVWGKFFCQLEQFEEKMVISPAALQQKLLSLLCVEVMEDLKAGAEHLTGAHEKLLILSQTLESFIMTTYPRQTLMEDQEVYLLKLAHNFFPAINTSLYSIGLQEEYFKMLAASGIFEKDSEFGQQEKDIAQSAIRILLGCVASGDKEYYVASSLRLESILKCPHMGRRDVFFIFSNLARIANTAVSKDDPDWLQYIASTIRCLLKNNESRLSLEEDLQQLPDFRTPNFGAEFANYCTCKEWLEFVGGKLKTEEVQYSEVLMRWLRDKTSRRMECCKEAMKEEKKRIDSVVDSGEKYNRLQEMFEDLITGEMRRQENADSELCNDLSVTSQRWRNTKRFFTGERGAWSSRKPEHYLWKLDRSENISRMRMRLARNYNYNTHEDASRLRDTGQSGNTQENLKADSELLAKLHKRNSSSLLEDEDVFLEQVLLSDENSATVNEEESEGGANEKERSMLKEDVSCHVIMLMDRIPGHLKITNKHIYFFSSPGKNAGQLWYNPDFKISIKKLGQIHSRRFNMSRTALEIFLVDQTNYFINFPDKKLVSLVYGAILSLHPPNLGRVGIRKPSKLLKESGLISKWVKREISNFDYLMQLNTISGRTYNDLNQYPVFPWVLKDYDSEKLDLEDERIYRDFSKPVGVQRPTVEERVRERYEEYEDPTMGRFHFGSHYSNAAGVMHYLIRLEPFTTLHIDLQSGRFDFADRQFFSIPSTWNNIFRSGTDLKELTPEFFYQPEFLKNVNGLDLGKLQGKEAVYVNDVILPKWAATPEDFIIKHREALESEYVSAHLHEWIDLIFGYKQTGPEAVKACNIFNYYTYEDNVNLDSIKDAKERRQIESIINNFGQTPTQLLFEPHPHRLSLEAARRALARGFTATFTGRRIVVGLFDHLSALKAHSVDICKDPVVFVGTPSIQTKALLVSGNPEPLVTLNKTGLLNMHGWLAFANNKQRPFTFQFDPNAHFDRSRWVYVGGPFAQDIELTCNLFVLSPNSKHLVSSGHWDNSFRVHSVEKGKLSSRIAHHNDIVTCMALDKAGLGDHLITGSRDTTCAIWKFTAIGIQKLPLQTLYGHDSEVLCVSISTELDLAASGAKDGTCLLHTIRQGNYIHTLRPREGLKCEIHQVAISNTGRLVIYSEDTTHRQRLLASVPPCIHLYTINGLLLLEKELAECINAMVIIDKYLITGNTKGFLTFRNLFSLQQLHSLNLLQPILCISVVLDHHSKLCTHILVGLANGKLIIVSVKDIPTEAKSN